jgi:hypothetical protein
VFLSNYSLKLIFDITEINIKFIPKNINYLFVDKNKVFIKTIKIVKIFDIFHENNILTTITIIKCEYNSIKYELISNE